MNTNTVMSPCLSIMMPAQALPHHPYHNRDVAQVSLLTAPRTLQNVLLLQAAVTMLFLNAAGKQVPSPHAAVKLAPSYHAAVKLAPSYHAAVKLAPSYHAAVKMAPSPNTAVKLAQSPTPL